ncbi:unnamed protein product [Amoebophrya sp. A120]|nr:unnamed protein product [Amoebophrya sp. A120]|eukprot:GSA120T00003790001.1
MHFLEFCLLCFWARNRACSIISRRQTIAVHKGIRKQRDPLLQKNVDTAKILAQIKTDHVDIRDDRLVKLIETAHKTPDPSLLTQQQKQVFERFESVIETSEKNSSWQNYGLPGLRLKVVLDLVQATCSTTPVTRAI